MKREVRFIGGHYQGETSWFGVSLSLVDSLDWILFYGGGPVPSGQVSKTQKLPSQLGLISNLVVAAAVKPGAHICAVLSEAQLDIGWHTPMA